jgi:hypothetical protein
MTFVVSYKPARTYRKQVTSFLASEFIGALTVGEQRAINICPFVACAYSWVFIEPLQGNDHVLMAHSYARRCLLRRCLAMR